MDKPLERQSRKPTAKSEASREIVDRRCAAASYRRLPRNRPVETPLVETDPHRRPRGPEILARSENDRHSRPVPLQSRLRRPRQIEKMVQAKTTTHETPRMKLTQQSILAAVLESMGEGVVVADAQGRFQLFNPMAEQLLGLGSSEIPPEQWSSHYAIFLPDGTTPFPTDELPLVRACAAKRSIMSRSWCGVRPRPRASF